MTRLLQRRSAQLRPRAGEAPLWGMGKTVVSLNEQITVSDKPAARVAAERHGHPRPCKRKGPSSAGKDERSEPFGDHPSRRRRHLIACDLGLLPMECLKSDINTPVVRFV